MANLYSILELPVFSEIQEVKKSFKKLALKYHPDINKQDSGTEEKFKRINHAYQILSDESRKRRYDAILRYQYNKPKNPVYTSYRASQSYSRRRTATQSNYRKSKTKKKYYNAVTLGFFGLGIILFQVLTELNESRLEKNYENRMRERSDLISKSKKAFARNEFRNAINLLNSIHYSSTTKEVLQLKNQYFQFSDSISSEQMLVKNYDSALYHLELILENKSKINASIYTRISNCYRNLGKTDVAISVLNNLLIANPNNLTAHKELGHIYNYDLGDYNSSLKHYERATKLIVGNYVDFYGKAYLAIINPKNHPPSDFDVFLEKSKIYYTLNQVDSSLIASRWATFLNPNDSEAHFVLALCWLKKGENKRACKEFQKIRNLGEIIPKLDSLQKISC
ncbi:DnaJ domain-containing protein [Hyphobacterium sp. CCMP332]|nr:DnaJ domain-containing protein [Hyphobacterium sp. CCMP332]